MKPPRLNLATYTVKRTATANAVNGRRVDGAVTNVTITANVQPASGRDLKVIPEARHAEDIRVLYTSTELYTARPSNQPDMVAIGGFLYEVFRVEPWPSHYRCFVAATGEVAS